MTSTARTEARSFVVVAALLFIGSAALTLSWSGSMSAMPGMPWMRMPGQTWPGAAAVFLGMWVVMMMAMMLPVLVPTLWRYRLGWQTAIAGLGYFSVWTLLGAIAFPLGIALAAVEIHLPELARAMPVAAGFTLVMAGALQLTQWKSRQLACCRHARDCDRTAGFGNAWRLGVRLGLSCIGCCAPLTAVLFVVGVMDLRAMVLVTAAVSAERLANSARVARFIGQLMLAAGSIYLGMLTNAAS